MAATNNVSLPEPLLAQIRSAAEAEHQTVDDLVREAVERHLRQMRLQKLYAYGQNQAREAGIPESRVDAIVREERDERSKLGR
jgi:Arc/MetJ-type ribon-helix-helix transcriptional regulator